MTLFAPIEHPFLNKVFLNLPSFFQSPPTIGIKSFVVTVFGPRKISSSKVTPSYIKELFCILQLLPITTFGPI